MLRAYVRLGLFIAGLIGAVILFAFAFTAAAVVVFVALVLLALFGRPVRVTTWSGQARHSDEGIVDIQDPHADNRGNKRPLIIDHDPNDLPPRS